MVATPTWSQSNPPKLQFTSSGARTGSEQPATAQARQRTAAANRVRIGLSPDFKTETAVPRFTPQQACFRLLPAPDPAGAHPFTSRKKCQHQEPFSCHGALTLSDRRARD